ncbi:hypothetical protein Cgig2_012082 [Carnegiea gigantea]|uniref:Uncharacterized protein n=1 Tax=Carnegiea gigantea TaxID=171969 RepID=A0A9Q1JL74_9CARY|nr:hypothetical protein Cgig2_012082 [Carnegiea gigantea]
MAADGAATFAAILSLLLSLASICIAYRPGDIVPMSRMGQYHSSRTVWHDMVGRHCPVFAVNREVLIPIPKPTGYTGADPYKITFQVGREKFQIPWLYIINRKSSEVPMIDMHLRYSGNDFLGVTAKVVDMPHHCMFCFPLELIHLISWFAGYFTPSSGVNGRVRYTQAILGSPALAKTCFNQIYMVSIAAERRKAFSMEERSEIDVTSGFYVLFGSGLLLSFILSIYVLQSSKEKLARFVRETVAESSMAGGVEKVE